MILLHQKTSLLDHQWCCRRCLGIQIDQQPEPQQQLQCELPEYCVHLDQTLSLYLCSQKRYESKPFYECEKFHNRHSKTLENLKTAALETSPVQRSEERR